MQFNISNKANIPKVKDGLDCRKAEIIRLCKAVSISDFPSVLFLP